jgi:hypothetical protein
MLLLVFVHPKRLLVKGTHSQISETTQGKNPRQAEFSSASQLLFDCCSCSNGLEQALGPLLVHLCNVQLPLCITLLACQLLHTIDFVSTRNLTSHQIVFHTPYARSPTVNCRDVHHVSGIAYSRTNYRTSHQEVKPVVEPFGALGQSQHKSFLAQM